MKCLIVLFIATMAHAAPQYFRSFAIPTVLPDGHLADTPEVAAAKVAHFAEHARALVRAPTPVYVSPAYYHYRSYYSGPFAIPTVLPDGHLADTPEVAAAKVAHYDAHVNALGFSRV